MIKVLRIFTRLNIGGPTHQAFLLAKGLRPLGYATTVAYGQSESQEGDLSGRLKDQGVDAVLIPGLKRTLAGGGNVRALQTLRRLIRQTRPHIVHTHMAKAGALGRVAARLEKVPVVVHTYHGHIFHGYFNPFAASFFLTVERALARVTDRLIAISEGQRNELCRRYRLAQEDRFELIPLGFNLEPFRRSRPSEYLRRRFGIPSQTVLVGTVGRLVPVKRVERFIEMAARLSSQPGLEPIRFVVVGDGPQRVSLEIMARRHGLDGRLFWTGWEEDLPSVYADLDVAVLTSRNEGTPVSLIEAQAAGVPVVAADVGGVREVVADGTSGWIVPADDFDGLVGAVSRLVSDADLRRRMGQAGGVQAQRFTAERLIRRMDNLYHRLLDQKGIST